MQANPLTNVRPEDDQIEPQRSSLHFAWLLAGLATLMFEIAAANGERPYWTALTLLCEGIIALALTFSARLLCRRFAFPKSSSSLFLIVITIPYAIEIILRIGTRTVPPLELLLLAYFRNAVLVLAAFADDSACQRVCCSISTFLAIFSSTLSHQLWLQCLVAVYAIAGTCWLMSSYWESLQFRIGATARQKLPRRWLLGIPGMLSLLVILPVAGSQTRVLQGFMPSSGGTEWYSESAREGVGDGDALVAGTDNIQSFAPIEDAPFMTSHEPSLYDMFDEAYNEPIRPQKQDRAIALPPQIAAKLKERHLAESKQAGKQFSTLRKFGEAKRTAVENRDSAALMFVKGRVPLHLKLESYDLYDGIDWYPEPLSAITVPFSLQVLSGRPWLCLPIQASMDIYGSAESHALKIIAMDTNRVPAPIQLMGVHIDQVDQMDMYAWAQPNVVKLDRERLPSLTVLHTRSRVPDLRTPPPAFHFSRGGTDNYHQCGIDEPSNQIRELAESLTEGIPSGWPQIQTIINYVRREYTLDRQAKPPADCENSVAHFLFESQCGPDYLFASSAVMMLRSLGYSARLVSGFYAHPDRYESRHDHTSVLIDDVHFWAEIRVGNCDWIPLEPTPGFDLLQPPPTLLERIKGTLLAVGRFLIDHILWLTASLILAVALWWARFAIADALSTLAWQCNRPRSQRELIRQTMWLLSNRCHWVGLPRPHDMTPSRWLRVITAGDNTAANHALRGFLYLAEWASYAPETEPPPQPFVREECLRAITIWSRKRLAIASSNKGVSLLSNLKSRHEVVQLHRELTA